MEIMFGPSGLIFLASSLVLAQDDSKRDPFDEMGILGESGTGFDCNQPVVDVIDALEVSPQVEIYLCLHESPDAGTALLSRLGSEQDEGMRNRLSRAVSVWLLGQVEREFTGGEVRALSPSDRRFLNEAIRARRGRETPCTSLNLDPRDCPHGAVLKHFDWYQPVANYSDRLLTDIDRKNLALIKNPPPPPEEPEPEEGADAVGDAAGTESVQGCSCTSSPSQDWRLGLLALPLLVRRRR
jgi:MYXO-CTERM domain-containing protein